jgi:enamine deaminase RidA (YjgF/YER057c/UK114 family)
MAGQAPAGMAGALGMDHEIITAPELVPPVGYAHAILAAPGRVLALGGQTALGPDGAITGDTMAEQFDVAAGNVAAALRAAGGRPEDIVSMQIFVTGVAAYKAALRELGPIWQRHFGRRYPATGLFGVTQLFDDGALIELMALAVLAEDGA